MGERLPGPGIQCRHDGLHFGVDAWEETRESTMKKMIRRLKDPTKKQQATTANRGVRDDCSELEDTEVGGRRLTSSH